MVHRSRAAFVSVGPPASPGTPVARPAAPAPDVDDRAAARRGNVDGSGDDVADDPVGGPGRHCAKKLDSFTGPEPFPRPSRSDASLSLPEPDEGDSLRPLRWCLPCRPSSSRSRSRSRSFRLRLFSSRLRSFFSLRFRSFLLSSPPSSPRRFSFSFFLNARALRAEPPPPPGVSANRGASRHARTREGASVRARCAQRPHGGDAPVLLELPAVLLLRLLPVRLLLRGLPVRGVPLLLPVVVVRALRGQLRDARRVPRLAVVRDVLRGAGRRPWRPSRGCAPAAERNVSDRRNNADNTPTPRAREGDARPPSRVRARGGLLVCVSAVPLVCPDCCPPCCRPPPTSSSSTHSRQRRLLADIVVRPSSSRVELPIAATVLGVPRTL